MGGGRYSMELVQIITQQSYPMYFHKVGMLGGRVYAALTPITSCFQNIMEIKQTTYRNKTIDSSRIILQQNNTIIDLHETTYNNIH